MSIIGLPSPGDEDWYDYATSLDTEARTIAAKETPAGAQSKADAALAAANAAAPGLAPVQSVNGQTGAVVIATGGTADITTHEGAADPHAGYLLEATASATYAAKAGATYTGAHDFAGATVTGISGGGSADPVPAGTGVQFVLTTGNDAADGRSWQTAKATVAAAQTALPAEGGVIQLGAGTWNGRFAITKANVTLRGIGWSSILRLPDATNVTAQTLTIAANNAVVEHLKIDGNRGANSDVTDGYSDGIGVWANNSTVQNVWITGARSHAYIVWGDPTSASSGAANATVATGERSGNKLLRCRIENNGTASDNRAAVDWAFVSGTGVAPVDNQAIGNLVICNTNSRTCFTSHSSKRLLIDSNVMHGFVGAGRMIELHTDTADVIVSNNTFVAKNGITDAVRIRTRTNRVTIEGNHFVPDGVSNNRIQAAVYVESSDCDNIKIVHNTLQDGPSFTGATLLKIVAGAKAELIGNTLLSHSGGGAFLVTSLTGTVTSDQIKARHNRGVNVDGVLTGLGTIDASDNFGVPGDTSVTAYTDEQVRDVVGATLVAGANVTITPNDGADTVTIAASGGGGGTSVGVGRLIVAGTTHLATPGLIPTAVNVNAVSHTLLWYIPVFIDQQVTCDALSVEVTTAGAAGTLAVAGIYNADAGYVPATLVGQVDPFPVDSLGVKTPTFAAPLVLPSGKYMIAFRTDATTLACRRINGFFSGGYSPTLGTNPWVSSITRSASGGSAALPTTALAPTGSATSNTGIQCFVFMRLTAT